jgi:predicted XRE-type DNA-binding protein
MQLPTGAFLGQTPAYRLVSGPEITNCRYQQLELVEKWLRDAGDHGKQQGETAGNMRPNQRLELTEPSWVPTSNLKQKSYNPVFVFTCSSRAHRMLYRIRSSVPRAS